MAKKCAPEALDELQQLFGCGQQQIWALSGRITDISHRPPAAVYPLDGYIN